MTKFSLIFSFILIYLNKATEITKKLLNDQGQLEIGFNHDQCLYVQGNFKNANKITGKMAVKSENCHQNDPGQLFSQVFYDKINFPDQFAICLKKYYENLGSSSSWEHESAKYYCLIGKFSQCKISKAKNFSELGKSAKWQWSFNEHGELMNGNLGGRYLNVNENSGKIKLSPGGLSRIWSFGSVAIVEKEDENVERPVIGDC